MRRPQAVSRLSRARQLEAQAKELLRRAGDGKADGAVADTEQDTESALAAVKIRNQTLKTKNREQDIKLRKRLASWAIFFVGLQLIASNLFFGFYLWHNKSDPSQQVMTAWLAASVVEVIGILLVIARSLFPVKSNGPAAPESNTRIVS